MAEFSRENVATTDAEVRGIEIEDVEIAGGTVPAGTSLARLQGRVALEEVVKRFPEWAVDESRAVLQPTSTTRGWVTLPVIV